MSLTTLSEMLEANGTFPGEEHVMASFDQLFVMSEEKSESPADLAWAFLQALDQLSNVSPELDPNLAARLYDWSVNHWATEPAHFFTRLCAILINVGSPESLKFLQDQLANCSDTAISAILTESVQDHPISRAAEEASVEEEAAE